MVSVLLVRIPFFTVREKVIKKINLGICIAPTKPFRAALDVESRQANIMSAHVLLPLAVNSKSE
jgi:hypothetical protein